MKRIASLAIAAVLAFTPVAQAGESGDTLRDGLNQLSEGSRLLLEGLLGEMAPMMEELHGMIDEMSAYEKPEILPNGDIIIRRKHRGDAPPVPEGLPPRDEGDIDI